MQAPAEIKTPTAYLASLPEPRKAALSVIHKAIRQAVPQLKPLIIYGMLGYGKFHYKYASGREGDTSVIGLASQKNYISLYILAEKDGVYLAEANKEKLGKVSVGKSCIRFKKLEDLNLKVAMQLAKTAAKLRQSDLTG